MSLSENPMFGAMIGQQISNNRIADQIQDQNIGLKKSLNETNDLAVSAAMQLVALRKEVEELDLSDASYSLSIAGVRAVTRELLAELRKLDPNNPLLDKKVRDRIFEIGAENQRGNQKDKNWKQRDAEAGDYRDSAFGAPNSGKGGPEKHQITSNAAVRAAAEVPAHITEREQFLGLIGKLRDSLEKANPNDPILKEKLIIDAS